MGWKTDQFLPSSDVINATIEQVVGPAVAEVFDEFRTTGGVEFTAWVGAEERWGPRVAWVGAEKAWGPRVWAGNAVATVARVRLRFRRTIKPGRSLFFAELKFDMPLAPTGISGMNIGGQVKSDGNQHVATAQPVRTVTYNQRTWIDP